MDIGLILFNKIMLYNEHPLSKLFKDEFKFYHEWKEELSFFQVWQEYKWNKAHEIYDDYCPHCNEKYEDYENNIPYCNECDL